jgi:hypothetical protein
MEETGAENVKAFRVCDAARASIAVRRGVLLAKVSLVVTGRFLETRYRCEEGCKRKYDMTDGFGSLVLMPYLARMEYSDRVVFAVFLLGRSPDPTASSRLWNASSSLRYS